VGAVTVLFGWERDRGRGDHIGLLSQIVGVLWKFWSNY
jgi:hypothetical protein